MLELPCVLRERYRVDREVGAGGFGALFKGFHLVLNIPIAIKVLRVASAGSRDERGELISRFLEEGRVLARLRHPNIVAALDLDLLPPGDDGERTPYIVMDWVEGTSLNEFLHARGRGLSLQEAWRFYEPLLQAVACAHEARVVHRDLKPANVMVVQEPSGALSPRVVDFGIAKIFAPSDDVEPSSTRTTSSFSAFTAGYAAPEQLTQSRTGPWTDVHALGLLFVELLTAKRPYGEGVDARLAAVDSARPTPSARGVDAGPLEAVIAKALALRVRDRYANATEMLEAARKAARDLGDGITTAPVVLAQSTAPPPEEKATIAERPRRPAALPSKTEATSEHPRPSGARRIALIAGAVAAASVAIVAIALSRDRGAPVIAAPVSAAPAASATVPVPASAGTRSTPDLKAILDRAIELVKSGEDAAEARTLLERIPIESPPFDRRKPLDYRILGDSHLVLGRLKELQAKRPAGTTLATLEKTNERTRALFSDLITTYAYAGQSLETVTCAQFGLIRAQSWHADAMDATADQVLADARSRGDAGSLEEANVRASMCRAEAEQQRKTSLTTIGAALAAGYAGVDPVDGTDCIAAIKEKRAALRAKLGEP